MRVDWSVFPGDEPTGQAPATGPLPPGKYHAIIEKAEVKEGWRKNDRNPTGDCVSLWIDVVHDSAKYRVFDSIPTNWLTKLGEVARCAGVPGPQRGSDEWDEKTLSGCRVYIQTDTYIVQQGKNAGQEREKIVGWLPAPVAAPKAEAKAPAPRTAAAKVAAARGDEAGGEDDVPF